MRIARAAVTVFIASFCTLVIELVAGRILAPYVGVSLYTWTSIIGVVLAGISAGAWAGGLLADRRPLDSTLAWLLLASGATSLLIAPATSLLAGDDGWLTSFGLATTLMQRVVVLSLLLFFLPCFFLGMISPVAVKLAVLDLESAGRVVGRIYAVSTLGSIAGTFTTGFFLIAHFGTRATLTGTGIVLILAALFVLLGTRGRAVLAALVAMAGIYALFDRPPLLPPNQEELIEKDPLHVEESQYYTIQVERTVREDDGAPLLALRLDHLLHSHTDLADPLHLEYGYLRLFNEVVEDAARRTPSPRFLFVGGGGYTLPRRILREHPEAEIDVVEIDPAVTRVAYRFLDAPREVRTFNEDARWWAMRAHERYDAIFIDAFNDLSVPYHLTTRELTMRLRELLEPDGALLANVIDDPHVGRFLASYARTLQSVFGERNVAIVMESEADIESTRSTFVVAAGTALPPFEHMLSDPRYLDRGIVLTDDFAPVDNMLAPLFTERFIDEEEGE